MAHTSDHYYVPHGSHWPIVGSIGLTTLLVGVASWLNGSNFGELLMLAGVVVTLVMIFGWFGTVNVLLLYRNDMDPRPRLHEGKLFAGETGSPPWRPRPYWKVVTGSILISG